MKEATRSAAQQKGQHQNGTIGSSITNQSPNNRESSHHSSDLANDDIIVSGPNTQLSIDPSMSVTLPLHSNENKGSLVAHQRSQSLSGLQANKVRKKNYLFRLNKNLN